MKRFYTDKEKEIIRKYWDSIVLFMDDDVREYTHKNSEKEDLVEWLDDYLYNAYKMAHRHYEEFLDVLCEEFGVILSKEIGCDLL